MKTDTKHLYEKFHRKIRPQKRIVSKNDFTYRKIIEILGKYVNKNSEILDIGCGAGAVDFYLASQGNRVVGIDISKNAIHAAQENTKILRINTNVKFQQINFPEEKPKGKYDLIIASEVLEHLKDDIRAVKIMSDLSRKGGKMIISVPSKNAPLYKMGLLRNFELRVGHLRRYDERSLKELLVNRGLSIEKIIKTEGILRNSLYTSKILGKLIRFIRGPISDFVTIVDEIAIKLFGESNIYIVASKNNAKKTSGRRIIL